MTYLVSYCGYTAAAVDVSEMKSEDSQARDDAATRLSVALKVLETGKTNSRYSMLHWYH